ncbi:MAG: insulinase family protein [Fibrobacter sp.]|nr:insulinase family protein [Fibrobacter sp.]
MKKSLSVLALASSAAIVACAGTSEKEAKSLPSKNMESVVSEAPKKTDSLPATYKDIVFPEFKYIAPNAADARVKISENITGYVIEDKTLPLIHFNIFFDEPYVNDSIQNEAAHELLSAMFRRGGSKKLSPQALDDSLEFIAASLAGSVGTFTSVISVECMAKDFPQMLSLSKEVFLSPAFDEKALEIQKANAANAYEHRFDNPSGILSALENYVNYEPNPRLWNATAEEFRKVKREDLVKLAEGHFQSGKIIFAISGDFSKDSMVTELKKYFESWPSSAKNNTVVPPLKHKNKPGIYLVDKDITQANISLMAPFVKRPHEDYYPTAVASFILGGGSFSSRLMTQVRSNNGLAYSIHSRAENDYRDQGFVTIHLQTKVESAATALQIIHAEIAKLAKEGPTDEELAHAKKTLIESLPSLFDTPASTTVLFARDQLLGKKDSHYIDYVNEINAVTKDQVKAMIAKYFDSSKMTTSIVGPADKLKDVGTFTQISIDSLDIRK